MEKRRENKEEETKEKKITCTKNRDHVSDVRKLEVRVIHRQTVIMSDRSFQMTELRMLS